MSIISLSPANFRVLFKAFQNPVVYPDSVIQLFWDTATAYVSDRNGGCFVGALSFAQQTLALNQMTAHLLAINDMIALGNTPGVTTQATVDKVSVSLEPPPAKSMWQYWLQTTPYGQQLLALLQGAAVGGFFFTAAAGVVNAFRR